MLVTTLLSANPSQQLTSVFKHINTLSGQFVQTVFDADNQPIATSKGSFAVQRPDKFNWSVTTPLRQITVADGKTVWLYQPDLKQVTKTAMTQKIGQTPLAILSGSTTALQNNFTISRRATGEYQLTAKRGEASFKKIVLRLKANVPSQMTLYDSLGQRTVLQFFKVRVNQAFKQKHPFELNLPKGVDVVSA